MSQEVSATEAINKFTREITGFRISSIKKRFVPWYINKYIVPGKITPLFHMIGILMFVGYTTNYYPHLKAGRKYKYA